MEAQMAKVKESVNKSISDEEISDMVEDIKTDQISVGDVAKRLCLEMSKKQNETDLLKIKDVVKQAYHEMEAEIDGCKTEKTEYKDVNASITVRSTMNQYSALCEDLEIAIDKLIELISPILTTTIDNIPPEERSDSFATHTAMSKYMCDINSRLNSSIVKIYNINQAVGL
jgi:hypothetical protein